LEIDYYNEGDILVVAPSGKLDTTHAPDFSKLVKKLFEDEPKACLIDLTNITFLSSSGLQSILAAAKNAKKIQMRFGVFGMQDMAYNVFTMSGFNQFIQSFSSKDEALANLL
jgi:anti-anti-sigma factor